MIKYNIVFLTGDVFSDWQVISNLDCYFFLKEQTYPTSARTKMKHIKVREWKKMITLARTSVPKLSHRRFFMGNKHPLKFYSASNRSLNH